VEGLALGLDSLIPMALSVVMIVFALLSLEFKNIIYGIITLCGFSVVLGVTFFYLSAPYAGVFQLAVLAGAVTVLFLVALMLTGKKEVD